MSRSDKVRFGRLALGDEERLTAGYAHHRAPAWSRDGRLLAISVGGEHDASWVLIDRRGRVARTLEGPASGAASFAPDGSLAFERRFGATSEIWLTPGGDAPPVRLLGGDGRLYRDPAFSPDGKQLCCAVADEPGGRSQLLLVQLADGARHALTAAADRAATRPAWSPNGEELVFEGTVGEDHAIYALSLSGNVLSRLTPEGECARRPAIIDESLLVYERQRVDAPSTLVLLDRERARAQVILEDGASRGEPSCFVAGKGKPRLAYSVLPAPDKHAHAAGEPPRFDIVVARLRGVTAEHAAETDADSASDSDSGSDSGSDPDTVAVEPAP